MKDWTRIDPKDESTWPIQDRKVIGFVETRRGSRRYFICYARHAEKGVFFFTSPFNECLVTHWQPLPQPPQDDAD